MKGVGNWSLSSTQRALKKHGSDMTRIKIGWISSFSSSGRANLMNHLGIKTNTSSFSAFCPFKKNSFRKFSAFNPRFFKSPWHDLFQHLGYTCFFALFLSTRKANEALFVVCWVFLGDLYMSGFHARSLMDDVYFPFSTQLLFLHTLVSSFVGATHRDWMFR